MSGGEEKRGSLFSGLAEPATIKSVGGADAERHRLKAALSGGTGGRGAVFSAARQSRAVLEVLTPSEKPRESLPRKAESGPYRRRMRSALTWAIFSLSWSLI